MIEEVNNHNKDDFEKLLNKIWKGATFESCKKDAKITKQFVYKLDNKYIGFLTCSIKTEYVPGCKSNKVGYLEGVYILPKYRKKGFATELVKHYENWAKSEGSTELASDLEIDNNASLQFHNKMGFEIVEKTVHLKKDIGDK